jgi:hypothetical protein
MIPHAGAGAFMVAFPPTTKSLAISSVHEPKIGPPWSVNSVFGV